MEGIRPVALLTQAGFLTIQERAGTHAIRIGCQNIQHNDYDVEEFLRLKTVFFQHVVR